MPGDQKTKPIDPFDDPALMDDARHREMTAANERGRQRDFERQDGRWIEDYGEVVNTRLTDDELIASTAEMQERHRQRMEEGARRFHVEDLWEGIGDEEG